jgi:endonuclease/exonuclease/phosphatase family metal-dependent hydrolase
MKIVQLNIWGGKLGKQIVEILHKEKPDIVCFQEVVVFPAEKEGDLFFSTLEKFKHQGGFEHSFFSPVFGYSYMNYIVDFGNAISSKYPFDATDTIFTRKEYIAHQDMLEGDFNIRNLQHVVLRIKGETLNVLNHHGHHLPQHKNGDEETLRQCKMIADYIQTLKGKIVLCGDFNLAPESLSLTSLNTLLVNQCLRTKVLTTRTALTHKTEVCDYIFTSSDVEVSDFRVLDDIASDHKALVVEF